MVSTRAHICNVQSYLCKRPIKLNYVLLYRVKAKFIACLKVDKKWIHIVPTTRCFFQSHRVSIQKSTHRHKGCDWLTSRKNYGSTITKEIRLVNISFDTPTTDLQLRLLPVMPAMQARVGAGAQAIPVTIRPGCSR
jgi:hypothetical protein